MADYDFPINPNSIGARIREERERLGYEGKQGEKAFAERIGVGRQKLRHWETKEALPKPEFLAYMANLGVDLNYVLVGRRQTSPDEAALLANYRASSKKNQDHLKAVGASFAESGITNGDEGVG